MSTFFFYSLSYYKPIKIYLQYFLWSIYKKFYFFMKNVCLWFVCVIFRGSVQYRFYQFFLYKNQLSGQIIVRQQQVIVTGVKIDKKISSYNPGANSVYLGFLPFRLLSNGRKRFRTNIPDDCDKIQRILEGSVPFGPTGRANPVAELISDVSVPSNA